MLSAIPAGATTTAAEKQVQEEVDRVAKRKIPLSRYQVIKSQGKKKYSTQLCVTKVTIRGKNPLDEPQDKYTWAWADAKGDVRIKKSVMCDEADVAQGMLDSWADNHGLYFSGTNRERPWVEYDELSHMIVERRPIYN